MEKTYLELEAERLWQRAHHLEDLADEAKRAAEEADRKTNWQNCPFPRTKWEAEQVELFKKVFGRYMGNLFRPTMSFEDYERKAREQGLQPMWDPPKP